MPVEIAIHDEEGQKLLARALAKVKKVNDGGQEFGMVLSSVVFRDVIEHFEEEEGPDGLWDRWSDAYSEHMQKLGKGGNKILQDSGNLRNAFRPTNFRKVGEGILWFNPARTERIRFVQRRGSSGKTKAVDKYMRVSDDKGFAYAHHHNKTREFMYLSDDASEKLAKVTLAYVLEK